MRRYMYKHVYIYIYICTLLCSQEHGYPMARRELRSCACLHVPNHFCPGCQTAYPQS